MVKDGENLDTTQPLTPYEIVMSRARMQHRVNRLCMSSCHRGLILSVRHVESASIDWRGWLQRRTVSFVIKENMALVPQQTKRLKIVWIAQSDFTMQYLENGTLDHCINVLKVVFECRGRV